MPRAARRRHQIDASQSGLRLLFDRRLICQSSALAARAHCENRLGAVRIRTLHPLAAEGGSEFRVQFSHAILLRRPWILPVQTTFSRFVPRDFQHSLGRSKVGSIRNDESARSLIRWRSLVAFLAVEPKVQHLCPPVRGCHPLTNHPRRIVADVLIVAARKLGNPVPFVVLVIAGDWLLHKY